MGFIQLKHDKSLGFPKSTELLDIPASMIGYAQENCFVSFRQNESYKPDKIISEVNACSRFINKFQGNIVFFGIESDSPIAPIILWDVAHTLPLGNTITMLEDRVCERYYEKEYYNGCFEINRKSDSEIIFKKIKKLPIEECEGLDDWTFGIPTGPGDATMLNAVVKRILEFNIPKKEIILCGRPGDNFKYFNEVRIIGEDIPAPPVLITKKKNVIAESAKYNNLCILHDRVFLPRNFYEIMKKFGDYYSYTTLQSLYFDDKYNLTPRRYSDYGYLCNGSPIGGVGSLVSENNMKSNISSFSKNLFSHLELNNGTLTANPINYNVNQYPTGSLYIVKRKAWEICPQDENLKWEEYEDVESGLRANKIGIVSRINPYGFTQSILSRPIVLGLEAGRVNYQTSNRKVIKWRNLFDIFPFKKKPLFRINEFDMFKKFNEFSQKYCQKSTDININPIKLTTELRYKIIIELIYKAEFELTNSNIKEFIKNCNNMLFLDTIPYSYESHLYYLFISDPNKAKEDLIFSSILINQLSLRKQKYVFMNKAKDYFCKKSIVIKIGSLISAIFLNMNNKKIIYNPDKINGYYKAILNSTPFIDYLEAENNL